MLDEEDAEIFLHESFSPALLLYEGAEFPELPIFMSQVVVIQETAVDVGIPEIDEAGDDKLL